MGEWMHEFVYAFVYERVYDPLYECLHKRVNVSHCLCIALIGRKLVKCCMYAVFWPCAVEQLKETQMRIIFQYLVSPEEGGLVPYRWNDDGMSHIVMQSKKWLQ
jgi:hypothetical protein